MNIGQQLSKHMLYIFKFFSFVKLIFLLFSLLFDTSKLVLISSLFFFGYINVIFDHGGWHWHFICK
jgi:hypothetical protein